MASSDDFQGKIVVPLRLSRRIESLKTLAEDLLVTRAESGSPINAPALATIYPLQYMESMTLITAFYRWMEIAGDDGVFVDGVHGRSEELPEREPDIFSAFSALIAIDLEQSPSAWPFLHLGSGLRQLQRARIIGEGVGGYPDPGLQRAINQSYLEQIARGGPSVCRISGVALAGVNLFDRLWLPIADRDGQIIRFASVTEPILRILGSRKE